MKQPKTISDCTFEQEWAKLNKKLESLATLKDGWNGYNAPAPDQKAVSQTRGFLDAIRDGVLLPSRVAASAIGGVGVTCRRDHRKVYVEFLNNGLVHALFADDARQSMYTQNVDTTSFSMLISDIEDYLNA